MDTSQCEHLNERELRFYCNVHSMPLCEGCKVGGHHQCKDVIDILETDCNLKDSDIYNETTKKLDEIFNRVNSHQKDIYENLSDLERGRVVFKNTLVHYKRKVLKHLDTLEEKILEEYDELYKEHYSVLKETEKVIGSHLSQLQQHRITIEEKSNLPFSDSIVILSEISIDLNSKEKNEEVILPSDYKEVSIDFRMVKDLLTFSSIASFGSLTTIKKTKIKPLEREVTFSTISTGDRSFKFTDILDIHNENDEFEIIDVKEMENDDLVMSDRISESIFIHNLIHGTTKTLKIGEYPDCIAVVDKSTIAVTQGRKNVVIVDIKIGKVLKTIELDDRAEGLTLVQAKLVVNCRNKGLQILNISGGLVGSIPHFTGRLYLHAAGLENILCSDQVNNNVTCLNLQGETLFSCSLTGLKDPYGITVDNIGNFYVTGMKSSAIYKFSSDGSGGSRFLRPRDGLKHPYILLWRRDGSLIVSNKSGRSVELYKYK